MSQTHLLYIGTHRRAHHADPVDTAFGIYTFRVDADGAATPSGLTETPKPGWIAAHPNGRVLYAVNEVRDFDGPDTGGVSAFGIDAETGKLRPLGTRSVAALPCHCAMDGSGRFLLVATFGGGTVHVIALEPDGSLGAEVDVRHHAGSSIHPKRQTAPHAHAVVVHPSTGTVWVPDLGTDRVEIYDLADGRLAPRAPLVLPPGSGPRHVAFSADGRFAWLVNEMSATVTVFADADGRPRAIGAIDLLPDGFTGSRSGAAILVHPDGRHLYATTRSHGSSGLPPEPGLDMLVSFRIDPATGALTLRGRVPSGGGIPRAIALTPDGERLYVTHQCSGTIVPFRIDAADGTPTRAGDAIATPVPVCIHVADGPSLPG